MNMNQVGLIVSEDPKSVECLAEAQGSDGKYAGVLKRGNRMLCQTSPVYETEGDAVHAVESLKVSLGAPVEEKPKAEAAEKVAEKKSSKQKKVAKADDSGADGNG